MKLLQVVFFCVAPLAMAQGQERERVTVDQVLDRYVEALGGKAALQRLNTRTASGTVETRSGARGEVFNSDIHIFAKEPDLRIQIYLDGIASRGINRNQGWSANLTEDGFRELSGAELAAEKRDADFHWETDLRSIFARLEIDTADSEGVYVVKATASDGAVDRLYFDAGTGLLVRRSSSVRIPQGVYPVEYYFEDFKEVDGVKLPFTIRRSFGAVRTVIKLAEIKHNEPLADSVFDVPKAN
jgi:hypothetical protein